MVKLDRWFIRRSRHERIVANKDSAINRLFVEKDDLDDDLRDALMKIVSLEHQVDQQRKRKVSRAEKDILTAARCVSCGGVHGIACPRVKRMRFRPDGQTPVEVEFWRSDEWPQDDVVWLEKLEIEEFPN